MTPSRRPCRDGAARACGCPAIARVQFQVERGASDGSSAPTTPHASWPRTAGSLTCTTSTTSAADPAGDLTPRNPRGGRGRAAAASRSFYINAERAASSRRISPDRLSGPARRDLTPEEPLGVAATRGADPPANRPVRWRPLSWPAPLWPENHPLTREPCAAWHTRGLSLFTPSLAGRRPTGSAPYRADLLLQHVTAGARETLGYAASSARGAFGPSQQPRRQLPPVPTGRLLRAALTTSRARAACGRQRSAHTPRRAPGQLPLLGTDPHCQANPAQHRDGKHAPHVIAGQRDPGKYQYDPAVEGWRT